MSLLRLALLGLIAYAAAVAETSLAGALEICHVAPSLIALAALTWQLVAPGPYAFLGAGAIALAGDLCAPGRVGAGAAAMLLVAYGVSRLRVEHYGLQVAVLFAGTTAWAVATGLLRLSVGDSAVGGTLLLREPVLVGAYTAALALPILMVVTWVREPLLRRARQMEGG